MQSSSRTVIYFVIVIAVFGIALAAAWQSIDPPLALAALVALVVGSALAFWRLWEDRKGGRSSSFPNQASALPKKVEKWVLGENGGRKP
jgi:ABC-type transport system involved in cytochrome c biogenesis permease component